jgi:hypothetical protein
MGTSLTGLTPATTYDALIKVGDNGPIDGTLKALSDGLGNDLPMQASSTGINFTGTTSGLVSGVSGAIQFSNGTAFASDATNLFWDDTNNRLGVGANTLTSRFQVKGDGTNPIARFESSAGANFLTINNSGQAVLGSAGANEPYFVNYNGTATESGAGQSLRIRQRANTGSTGNTLIQYWADGLFSGTTSGIALSHEFLSSGFSGAAGSANYRNLSIGYTINNSGAQTGTATGIFLNATETALNGQTHNLMDLQVGGSSRFLVSRTGVLSIGNNLEMAGSQIIMASQNRIVSNSSGVMMLINNAFADFSRLQLGGTTSSFPAIKRNGATIDFRLADDSNFCAINAGATTIKGSGSTSATTGLLVQNSASTQLLKVADDGTTTANILNTTGVTGLNNGALYVGSNFVTTYGQSIGFFGATVASAIVEIQSTTKGFLPPRMTDTQRAAIATPAEGLLLFNTTNKGVAYRDGTNWGYLSGAPQTVAASGGTVNVSFASGNIIDMTLTASTTLTLSAHVVGTYIFELIQGGSGSYTITWPASVKWSGGTAPTLTTTVGKTDIVTLFHDGTNFYGTYSLNY